MTPQRLHQLAQGSTHTALPPLNPGEAQQLSALARDGLHYGETLYNALLAIFEECARKSIHGEPLDQTVGEIAAEALGAPHE